MIVHAGVVASLLLALVPRSGQDLRPLCASPERTPAELARQLEPLGETGRTALASLAVSPMLSEALCGIAGLSALGDVRVIPPLVAALQRQTFRPEAYRFARWATHLAGGPDPGLGAALVDVVRAFEDRALWAAAGNDGLYLLGEIDHSDARARLLAELERPHPDPALDALVHALARQGEPRARDRVATLGAEALRAKSGNATPEQASRLGEVAFYQLALALDSLEEGLATLSTIAARDQQYFAAWAMHTLCARALRRPDERAAIDRHRVALAAALDQRGVAWQAPKGPVGCQTGR